MTKIKERLSRYGVAEWLTLIGGVVIAALQIRRYEQDGLGDLGIELVVLAVWLLLLLAPKTLVDLIKKRSEK